MEIASDYLEDFKVIGTLEENIKMVADLNEKIRNVFLTLGEIPLTVNITLLIKKEHYKVLIDSLNFDYNNSGDTREIVHKIIDKVSNPETKNEDILISLNSLEIFNVLRITKYYYAVLSMSLKYRQENAGIIINEEEVKKDIIDSLDN